MELMGNEFKEASNHIDGYEWGATAGRTKKQST